LRGHPRGNDDVPSGNVVKSFGVPSDGNILFGAGGDGGFVMEQEDKLSGLSFHVNAPRAAVSGGRGKTIIKPIPLFPNAKEGDFLVE